MLRQNLTSSGPGHVLVDANIGEYFCLHMDDVEVIDIVCKNVSDDDMAILSSAEDIDGTDILRAQKDGKEPIYAHRCIQENDLQL